MRWERRGVRVAGFMKPLSLLGIPLCAAALVLQGCSIKQMAVRQIGDALSGGGDVFASDDDPDLVGDALPFSLKLMESVLAQTPEHEGLLTSLASGFTQYAYGWVQLEADEAEEENYDLAEELRGRAARLYLRGKAYGMRGLEARHPGFGRALGEDVGRAMGMLRAEDVELIYWTALAWGGATALSLDNAELVGDLAYIEAMMDRALALDPEWSDGAIHGFFVTYEMSRMSGEGDPVENATGHYRRALELSKGRLASVHVAFAESVAVSQQDKDLFVATLNRALDIDVDEHPSTRLVNKIYQRRAKWLLTRIDWLFL